MYLVSGRAGVNLEVGDRIRIRASVNEWISRTFPSHRKYLSHSHPEYVAEEGAWAVELGTKNINGHSVVLGRLLIGQEGEVLQGGEAAEIVGELDRLLAEGGGQDGAVAESLTGERYRFCLGDGVQGLRELPDGGVDLLLTDPPYGISKAYTCEEQVPRRLRKDGRDFIMPKGNFGDWDKPVSPREWLEVALPKVGGWIVTFCAQAQIGEYSACLEEHKFVAVGTLVWHKTNPVPFNHKFKPINAWEAVVVGKRPGTKFNGRAVHNVFRCKSPSPQQRIHPTQKPLDLMEQLVELFSSEGDLVYDPFGGAATTLIAASCKGRNAISYERDPEIYRAACKRIQEQGWIM